MRIIDLQRLAMVPVLDYQSTGAAAVTLAEGQGSGHIHWLRIAPGGAIGPHPAGPAQLLVPVEGEGWAAGADAVRHAIAQGQAAYIAPGEVHSKGSEQGMSALMIQLSAFTHCVP